MAWSLTAFKSLPKCHLYTEDFSWWICSVITFPISISPFPVSLFSLACMDIFHIACSIDWLIWPVSPKQNVNFTRTRFSVFHFIALAPVTQSMCQLCWVSSLSSFIPVIEAPTLLYVQGQWGLRWEDRYKFPGLSQMKDKPIWKCFSHTASLRKINIFKAKVQTLSQHLWPRSYYVFVFLPKREKWLGHVLRGIECWC